MGRPRLPWLLALSALSVAAPAPATPVPAQSAPAPRPLAQSAAMAGLLDYARAQNTTGFLIIRDGKTLVEENWPAPADDPLFAMLAYERNKDGALLEDVASQQKSFVSMLAAIAIDKGMLDIAKPVSAYIGAGWSKASPEQEAKIRVIDVLTMSSGLNPTFGYAAPPGTVFLYNTPVYAITKRIVAAAAGQPLEQITRDWLTGPAGMKDTEWRKRPAAMPDVGNNIGLVTSPRDTAAFGMIVLSGGLAANGQRIVSAAGLEAMFTPSATNPAYGRLWWLNGSAYTIRATGARLAGPLIPAAPADLVGALGALERRLYVVRSRKLIVVRMGAAAKDPDFDQQLWLRLVEVID
ncbi:serine hydrolase [Sphingomonas oligophenolica]|uniref:Serine hydrolase domain-containing protein n=1 Tax=Sphingomonas oligophenolica TaxID=301154 RepID=A0ABU9Y719_9SPHN